MRVLLTGSSGWLGRYLAPRLAGRGHTVVGLDPVPSPTTRIVGFVADRALLHRSLREHGIDAIVHAGALHKPHVESHDRHAFIEVNVTGTANLLEEAVAPDSTVRRFVFTSTTSLMISRELRAGGDAGRDRAAWITEELAPLQPRNIYGVSKLAAEHLCRLYHELHGLPVLILRTARFFPEADDMAHAIAQSSVNTKLNELLFRRLTVEDAADSHIAALDAAEDVGFDTFIVAARSPFRPDDCADLLADAPSVVARYFPHYPEIYARHGWTMFDSIDRVYDASKLARRLGFVCRTGFGEALAELPASLDRAGTVPP